MTTIISDGTASSVGNKAKVSDNRLFTHAISETEAAHSAEIGDAYNINTGTIGLTSTTASGVLYLKNNENQDLFIEAFAAGIGSAGTTTDVATITMIRNPTTGTLISDATAVDINQNRNFGSSKTLTADAYKGAEGKTVTNGDNIVQFYVGAGARLFAPIDLILTKGDSIAITIDTNTSTGTTNIYSALVVHLKDSELKD
jgi:hypothetical protein